MNPHPIPHQRLVSLLATAGLLPFIIFTLLAFLQIYPDFAVQGLNTYSTAIITFLAGTWWGFALMMKNTPPKTRAAILLASNLVVIAAVFLVILAPPGVATFALAAFYPALLAGERLLPGLSRQPAYYRQMRVRVSMVALGTHLLTGWTFAPV
ncbi:MAG: DUF3429 domain-containing protein [Pseudomonadota bacterium]